MNELKEYMKMFGYIKVKTNGHMKITYDSSMPFQDHIDCCALKAEINIPYSNCY